MLFDTDFWLILIDLGKKNEMPREPRKGQIPIVFEFYPALLDKNWIKNFNLVFKNYKFFYDLRNNNKKQKFNQKNLTALISKVNSIEGKHTDLMIV